MRIIEHRLVGKTGRPELCEDAIVIAEHYVAVIDGATDKSGQLIDGKTPGKAIADILMEFFRKEERQLFGMNLVEELNRHIGDFLRDSMRMKSAEQLPSAAIAVFTRSSNHLTLVGDVRCTVNGTPLAQGTSRTEKLLGEVRALYLRLLLMEGASIEELRRDDPGRKIIMPILRKQHLLRNADGVEDWSYGAIDGRPVPETLVRVCAVKPGDEIVFCTDGYPEVLPSLSEAERALERSLLEDPLYLAHAPGTKGLALNAISYDDRAYARFIVQA